MMAVSTPRRAKSIQVETGAPPRQALEPAADIHRDQDDAIVVLGLGAAGLVPAAALATLFQGAAIPAITPAQLTRLGVETSDFDRLQQLWHRFKVPHGRASLVRWQMLCAALGSEKDLQRASDLMTGWLEAAAGARLETQLARLAEAMGLEAGGAVLTNAEFEDVMGLSAAVLRRVPLYADRDPAAMASRLRAAGWKIDVSLSKEPAGPFLLADLCPGQAAQLPNITRRTRAAWEQLPPEERTGLLIELQHRILALEQVRQIVSEGLPLENRQIVDILGQCLSRPVGEWPTEHLSLATLWWCWREAAFAIQELNQSIVTLPAIALFLCRRLAEYAGAGAQTGSTSGEAVDLIDLARRLGGARQQVERRFLRCLQFDGSDWERREFLVSKASLERFLPLPLELREHLLGELGTPFPGDQGDLQSWDRYLEAALETGRTPTQVLQSLARWTANSPQLSVDYAIFTVPMGNKLEEPWTMDFDDVFCYTGFRRAFNPADFGVPLDLVGVQNAVGQRMRYNVVKKAQNYALVKRFPPQSFNLPDLSVAEDANHGGHQAAGIRLALRIPVAISYRGRVWKGLADLRLNRVDYRPENHFRPEDVALAHRYVWWARGIAEAAYRRDLTFEKRWCGKVTSLED
jgi:hypothetical protein